MVNVMSRTHIMRWSFGISLAMSTSVCWSLSHAGTLGNGRAAIGPATSHTMSSSVFTAMEAAMKPMPSAAVPVEDGLALRTLPTVSKPVSEGGRTLVPYIGAGFGGGYATELDRALNAAPSAFSSSSGSSNVGLKSLLGQNLVPNEVQLGIRFPF